MAKYKILLVDDEPFFFELISELLGKDYEFTHAESAKCCVDMAVEQKPDLILMDVQMPEMNGYEGCAALKANPETKNIPVFFISANDSIEEKVQGYDVGGDDYIVKPLDGPEIDRKIKNFLERFKRQSENQEALHNAITTAKTALSSQGEQGIIIDYLTNSFLCQDLDALTNQLLVSLNEFDYYFVVRLHSRLASIVRNSKFKWNPIEESIMDTMIEPNRRINENDEWVLVSGSNVNILLRKTKKYPDEEKLGRVRDHVAFLMQGAEARIHSLDIEQSLDEQTSSLFNLVKSTHRKLEGIHTQRMAARRSISDSIDGFYIEFENAMAKVGLTERQEKDIIDATDKMVNHLIDICADKLNDHALLTALLDDLKRMVD